MDRLIRGSALVGIVLVAISLVWPVVPGPTTGAVVADTVEGVLGLASDPLEGAALERRRLEAVEVLTAVCMHRRGWPYRVHVPPALAIPDADLAPLAWAERWGFGVATSIGHGPPDTVADPNLEMVASFGTGRRAAWITALVGGAGRAGCRPIATERVMGLRDRLLAPLALALADFRDSIDASDVVRHALDAWTTCLLAAGIEPAGRAATIPALIDVIGRRLDALRGPDGGLPSPAEPSLAALADEERRMAVAVARCEAPYLEARQAAERSMAGAFLSTHGDALRAVGDTIRAAEAALPAAHAPGGRRPSGPLSARGLVHRYPGAVEGE